MGKRVLLAAAVTLLLGHVGCDSKAKEGAQCAKPQDCAQGLTCLDFVCITPETFKAKAAPSASNAPEVTPTPARTEATQTDEKGGRASIDAGLAIPTPSSTTAYNTTSVEEAVDGCSKCDSWACQDLSERYRTGDGVPKDPVRARQYAIRTCNECGYIGAPLRGWCAELSLPAPADGLGYPPPPK
jgi:hypothetical protein